MRVQQTSDADVLVEFDADYTLAPYVGNQLQRADAPHTPADGSAATMLNARWAKLGSNFTAWQAGNFWQLIAPGLPDVVWPAGAECTNFLVLEFRNIGANIVEVTFDCPQTGHQATPQFHDDTGGANIGGFFSTQPLQAAMGRAGRQIPAG